MSEFQPEPRAGYEGSALQRYHLARRDATKERDRLAAEAASDYAAHMESTTSERMAALRLHRAGLVRHHAAKRRAMKMQRTPAWADEAAIREVYERAQAISRETGIQHHVDHEIPLQGRLVSGLHVHNNLQILTGSENSKKRNHFEIDA
jgi:hypothetical protein